MPVLSAEREASRSRSVQTEVEERPALFDIWSSIYDLGLIQRVAYRPVHNTVVGEIQDIDEPRLVTDVGCGTGILTTRLGRKFAASRVVGCDFSPGMLSTAQAKEPPANVSFELADAAALPFDKRTVDVITCTESFHWYPDQPGVLAEFRRVLRPGGLALIAFVNPPVQIIGSVVARSLRTVGQTAQFPTPRALRQLLGDAGFDVLRQYRARRFPIIVFPAFLTVAQRLA